MDFYSFQLLKLIPVIQITSWRHKKDLVFNNLSNMPMSGYTG